jgi:hypothetical protein
LSNLLCSARSRGPPEDKYCGESAAANDGLQRTNRALIPHVVGVSRALTPRVGDWCKGRQAETSAAFQQYGGGIKKQEQAERRSDLKEEASDLERQVWRPRHERVQEREREWHKMELPLTELEQLTLDDHIA